MSWAHVALRPVCDSLELDTNGQWQRLQRQSWTCACMMHAQVPGDDQRREMVFIDRRTFTMWLATIDTGRADSVLADPTILE